MNTLVETLNGLGAVWLGWTVTSAWQGALLLAVILAVTLLWRGMPPAFRYALYLVVLLKLTLPPVLHAPWNLFGYGPESASSPPSSSMAALPYSVTLQPASAVESTALSEPARAVLTFDGALLAFQSLGALGCIAILCVQAVRHARRYRAAAPAGEEPVGVCANDLAGRLGIKSGVDIRVSESIQTPHAAGFFRPHIMLPAWIRDAHPEELRAVLAHELGHLRRRDPLVNTLQLLVQCYLWWNPLAWWVNHRIRTERELCCDDLVLGMGLSRREAYSRTLVKVAEHVSTRDTLLATVGMADAFRPVAHRIRRALEAPARSFRLSPAALVCIAAFALLVLPSAGLPQNDATVESGERRSAARMTLQFPDGAIPTGENLTADQVRIERGRDVTATGNVRIELNGTILTSDHLTVKRPQGEGEPETMRFEGNVTLTDNGQEFRADTIVIDSEGKVTMMGGVLFKHLALSRPESPQLAAALAPASPRGSAATPPQSPYTNPSPPPFPEYTPVSVSEVVSEQTVPPPPGIPGTPIGSEPTVPKELPETVRSPPAPVSTPKPARTSAAVQTPSPPAPPVVPAAPNEPASDPAQFQTDSDDAVQPQIYIDAVLLEMPESMIAEDSLTASFMRGGANAKRVKAQSAKEWYRKTIQNDAVKFLSRPQLLLKNGTEGMINIGGEVPVETGPEGVRFVEIGNRLGILPVWKAGEFTLAISVASARLSEGSAGDLQKSETKVNLKVNTGDAIVLKANSEIEGTAQIWIIAPAIAQEGMEKIL